MRIAQQAPTVVVCRTGGSPVLLHARTTHASVTPTVPTTNHASAAIQRRARTQTFARAVGTAALIRTVDPAVTVPRVHRVSACATDHAVASTSATRLMTRVLKIRIAVARATASTTWSLSVGSALVAKIGFEKPRFFDFDSFTGVASIVDASVGSGGLPLTFSAPTPGTLRARLLEPRHQDHRADD